MAKARVVGFLVGYNAGWELNFFSIWRLTDGFTFTRHRKSFICSIFTRNLCVAEPERNTKGLGLKWNVKLCGVNGSIKRPWRQSGTYTGPMKVAVRPDCVNSALCRNPACPLIGKTQNFMFRLYGPDFTIQFSIQIAFAYAFARRTHLKPFRSDKSVSFLNPVVCNLDDRASQPNDSNCMK